MDCNERSFIVYDWRVELVHRSSGFAGTAGVSPAMRRSSAVVQSIFKPFRASALIAGETPAVPANHLIVIEVDAFCFSELLSIISLLRKISIITCLSLA